MIHGASLPRDEETGLPSEAAVTDRVRRAAQSTASALLEDKGGGVLSAGGGGGGDRRWAPRAVRRVLGHDTLRVLMGDIRGACLVVGQPPSNRHSPPAAAGKAPLHLGSSAWERVGIYAAPPQVAAAATSAWAASALYAFAPRRLGPTNATDILPAGLPDSVSRLFVAAGDVGVPPDVIHRAAGRLQSLLGALGIPSATSAAAAAAAAPRAAIGSAPPSTALGIILQGAAAGDGRDPATGGTTSEGSVRGALTRATNLLAMLESSPHSAPLDLRCSLTTALAPVGVGKGW